MRIFVTKSLLTEPDVAWNFLQFGVWCTWELTIGIVIGCIPGLPKFFQTYGPKLSSFFSGLTSYSIKTASRKRSVVTTDSENSWNDPHKKQTMEHGTYQSIDDVPTSRATMEKPGMEMEDLERGQKGGRGQIVRTVRVESDWRS